MSIPDEPEEWGTPQSRRNWLLTNLPESYWLEQSGARLLSALRDSGFRITTQSFYEIRRTVLATAAPHAGELHNLGADDPIPQAWLQEPTRWQPSRQFLYNVKVIGKDYQTGERVTSFVSISSDELLTKRQLYETLTDMFMHDPQAYGIVEAQFDLYRVFAR